MKGLSGKMTANDSESKLSTRDEMEGRTFPPPHFSVKQPWFDDSPSEPGYYWFYGEPLMGEMGGHYNGTVEPEHKLYLVEVVAVRNGVLAVTRGHFMPLRKWDGVRRGFLGKWSHAVVPDAPENCGGDTASAG